MSTLSQQRLRFMKNYKECIRSPVSLKRKTDLSIRIIQRYLKKMKTTRKISDRKITEKKKKIRHNPQISSDKLASQYKCSSKTIRNTLKVLVTKKDSRENISIS